MANAIITKTYQDHSIAYQEDGWFNATQAAAKFGKRVDHWLETKETQEYIAALCEDSNTRKDGYLKAKRGNNGGTWLHPKLAVMFARWLDVRFSIWCDMQIDDIIRGKDDWAKSRHITAVSYKAMSAVLQEVRAEDGKETKMHHYANEARLVNWALTGEFCAIDRDALSSKDLDLLGALEVKDIALIGRGRSYEERKESLKEYAEAWRAKHALKIAA